MKLVRFNSATPGTVGRPAIVLLVLLALAVFSASGKSAKASAAAGKPTSASLSRSALVDVNHASVAELMSLPGIAEAYAAKIVKNRPYANKTQLSSKGVLPIATYRSIKALIVAKQ